MKNSQALMKQAGILPKLKLGIKEEGKAPVPTGPHKVKILEDKIKKGKDAQGNIIDVVHYVVEEEGVKKFYEVPVKDKIGNLHYLVQRLSEIPEGQEIILEMKKKGIKNYISVAIIGDQLDIEDDEVHDGDEITENSPFPEKTMVGTNKDIEYPEEDVNPNFDIK